MPGIMSKYDIAIIGGDMRIACMAPVFIEKGHSVTCFRTMKTNDKCSYPNNRIHYSSSLKEALESAQTVVCGIPFENSGKLYCADCSEFDTKDAADISLTEMHRCLRKNQKVFGGVIPADFIRVCEEREIDCYDFMKDEPLTLFNATATAEGAILEALIHHDSCLHMSKTLVLGYGRCGRVLADKLKGLSACVTVCSSNAAELALASSLGFTTMHLSRLCQNIQKYEYIFNTIPAHVINRLCMQNIKYDSIVIDIASNKIGADYDAAALYKVNCRFCPGLPGKYASRSCARQLVDFVLKKLNRK